ncbi:MAG: bifunctional 3,4-dihydroxy-2-butanone-4-phosphate synthase/GTP cyclohydrolase II [Methylophilaceae bacterium]
MPHRFISTITDIIADIKSGKMVILVDDENRENEGDFVIAAEFATAEHVNFMAKFGRGLICLTLTEERCKKLDLPPMVENNGSRLGTNFTLSIEAAKGVTTGISAADRATTIKAAIAKDASASSIVSPGHVFPLTAVNGGVLVRAGHTEAGCDLTALAGCQPASVICEILKDDGEMARLPDLVEIAHKHGIKIGTIADLIRYRSENEKIVERVVERVIKTPFGNMNLIAYRDKISQETHLAIIKGSPNAETETLVRVHEPLSVFDLLDSSNRTHSWSALDALKALSEKASGVLVFLYHGESGLDLVERISHADEPILYHQELRTYGIGSQILLDLGVRKMRLMATPRKMPSMDGFGLEITGYLEPQKAAAK